jgi:hypothetical protein
MAGAEVLDAPRLLALQTTPATFTPGETHRLEALAFQVPGDLRWSFCATAWAPTEPLSCPTGAVELGTGNPLEVDLPDLPSGWLLAEDAEGQALPATKKLEAGVETENPGVTGLTSDGQPLPANLAPLGVLPLAVAFDPMTDASELVVSWYVTAGTLEPRRSLGSEAATLTAPEAAPESGDLEVFAVIRDADGGTAWTKARLAIGGTP